MKFARADELIRRELQRVAVNGGLLPLAMRMPYLTLLAGMSPEQVLVESRSKEDETRIAVLALLNRSLIHVAASGARRWADSHGPGPTTITAEVLNLNTTTKVEVLDGAIHEYDEFAEIDLYLPRIRLSLSSGRQFDVPSLPEGGSSSAVADFQTALIGAIHAD